MRIEGPSWKRREELLRFFNAAHDHFSGNENNEPFLDGDDYANAIAKSAGTKDLDNIDFGQTLGINPQYTKAFIVDQEIAYYYGNSGFAPWELNIPCWEMPSCEEINDVILDDEPSPYVLITEPEINNQVADEIEEKARQNNPELKGKWWLWN